jgi:hypothetical protein
VYRSIWKLSRCWFISFWLKFAAHKRPSRRALFRCHLEDYARTLVPGRSVAPAGLALKPQLRFSAELCFVRCVLPFFVPLHTRLSRWGSAIPAVLRRRFRSEVPLLFAVPLPALSFGASSVEHQSSCRFPSCPLFWHHCQVMVAAVPVVVCEGFG